MADYSFKSIFVNMNFFGFSHESFTTVMLSYTILAKNATSLVRPLRFDMKGEKQMNLYGVLVILGILAFLGIVATTASIVIILKMKKKIDTFEQRDREVGASLSNLYKANTFDATREVIGELMDKWLGY